MYIHDSSLKTADYKSKVAYTLMTCVESYTYTT